jgi:DNA-binding beta-propeller fold protein YncE
MYAQMLYRAELAGVLRPAAVTPAEFQVHLAQRWPDGEGDFAAMTDAYVQRRYGDIGFEATEVEEVCSHWQRLRALMRRAKLELESDTRPEPTPEELVDVPEWARRSPILSRLWRIAVLRAIVSTMSAGALAVAVTLLFAVALLASLLLLANLTGKHQSRTAPSAPAPYGLAVDSGGNIYVTDTTLSRIAKLSPSGRLLAWLGAAGVQKGQLNQPQAIAVDRVVNLYDTDTENGRIQKLSSNGKLIATWGEPGIGAGQFQGPAGIAVDSRGVVYVADTFNNRILKLSPQGRQLAEWQDAGPTAGALWGPHGIAVNSHGNVYVADTFNARVLELSPEGALVRQWDGFGAQPGGPGGPMGLSVDRHDNVYVVDYAPAPRPWLQSIYRVEKFSPAGKPLAAYGTTGSRLGQVRQPHGVAVDAQGNIYIADTANHRVEKLSPGGSPLASWVLTYSPAARS